METILFIDPRDIIRFDVTSVAPTADGRGIRATISATLKPNAEVCKLTISDKGSEGA